MGRNLTNSSGKNIIVDDNPIASGGQGAIFKIIAPQTSKEIAKLYKSHSSAQKSQRKIEFMVMNSPITNSTQKVKNAIVWPIEPLYENGNFIGYTMPFVKDTIALADLCIPKPPHLVHGNTWQKFDIKNPKSFHIRLSICYNIAQAVLEVHKSKSYVLVDMKPDNIRINEKGHISIIDLDSIQISKGGKVLYHAEVCTDGYAPPEHYTANIIPQKSYVQHHWDYFSYACLSYQVLFAVHPFSVGQRQSFTELYQLIQHNYYAHGRKLNGAKVPRSHSDFKHLSKVLKELYRQCFDDGHSSSNKRPDFSVWTNALLTELQSGNTQKIDIGKGRSAYTIKPKNITTTATGQRNAPYNQPRPTQTFNPPVISYFNPPTIHAYHATLSWSAPTATTVQINGKTVPSTGTVNVPLISRTYTLVATDSSGRTDTKSRNVQLTIVAPLANVMNINNHVPINKIAIALNPSIKLQSLVALNHQGIGLNKSLPTRDYQSLKNYERLKEQTIKLK